MSKINILLNLGFQIMHSDLNYHCFVDNNDYLNLINYSAKKRINKCLRDGYISKTYNLEEWPKVYNLLRESRTRRGYKISMNNNEFEDHIRNFSKYTKIFGVEKNKDLVAGSVCIRNNLNSLYVFYWGEGENQSNFSPVTLLALEIYNYCKTRSIKILDVGTSTIEGLPNHGLIRFKKNLGFSESLKLTLSFSIK